MIESEFTRVIAPTLLALILVSNIACSGSPQTNSADGNSPQANTDQWQPGPSIPGMLRRNLVSDPRQPGPFKYQLRIPGGARAAVHRHSKDVHVKVLSGSMFIIIGEPLESSRAQSFAAGSTFVVPAHAWHDEWWEEDTVLEAEGVGPMETIYKSQVRLGNNVLDARRNMGNSNVQALYLATIGDAHSDLYNK
jgi:hypothetical protein